jgi:hypothetical protein
MVLILQVPHQHELSCCLRAPDIEMRAAFISVIASGDQDFIRTVVFGRYKAPHEWVWSTEPESALR